MALTSAANYQTWNTAAANLNATALATSVSAAQRAMERFCGLPAGGFEQGSKTENFRGNGNAKYVLPCVPVTAVASVKVIDADGTTELSTLSADSYRVVDANAGTIEYISSSWGGWGGGYGGSLSAVHRLAESPVGWPWGTWFRVAYTGGYASGSEDLKLLEQICWQVLDLTVLNAGRAFQSESLGSYTYTLLAHAERAAAIRQALSPYKRWVGN